MYRLTKMKLICRLRGRSELQFMEKSSRLPDVLVNWYAHKCEWIAQNLCDRHLWIPMRERPQLTNSPSCWCFCPPPSLTLTLLWTKAICRLRNCRSCMPIYSNKPNKLFAWRISQTFCAGLRHRKVSGCHEWWSMLSWNCLCRCLGLTFELLGRKISSHSTSIGITQTTTLLPHTTTITTSFILSTSTSLLLSPHNSPTPDCFAYAYLA